MELVENQKFWEEIITYFPWYDMDRIKTDLSNNSSTVGCVFVAEVTFLKYRCIAAIGEFLRSRCLATTGDTRIDTKADGSDLWITPFGWAQVLLYTYQVP
jgi:hypothetical protein